MLKYIFFDLDGTITDSAPGITNSVKYALDKMDEPIPEYDMLKKFIGPPLSYGFSVFCGLSEEASLKAVECYREYYREKGIFECKVYDGFVDTLKSLKASGKTLILATSKPEQFALRILEHFGLLKYFDIVAGATFDESRNTKDMVLEYAVEKSGLKNKIEAIMVGDRFHDIKGAKYVGIPSVGVLYGFGSLDELKNAGADYIAADPSELLEILNAL